MTLSTNQVRVLEALLCEATIVAAAEHAGVTRRTVQRYLQDADFLAELHKRQDAALAAAVAALSGLAGDAVDDVRTALDELAGHATGTDATGTDAYRLGRLALQVLAERRRQAELDDLVARVAAIEATIGARR